MPNMKIVAEAGPCDGDMDYAINAASMAIAAGVWGFKVQMYTADTLATKWAPRYDHLPSKHDTQHEVFSKVLPLTDWYHIADICTDNGVEFFASCFNMESVDTCEDIGVSYYKVASGEITNVELLRYVGETGKHVILSTGASASNEVVDALGHLGLNPDKVTLLACSLEYPAADGLMGRIRQLRLPLHDIGYSDHTYGTDSTYLAVASGASMLEKHFTVTPGMGGDHDFAVTPTQLHEMSLIANRAEALMWTPDGSFAPAPNETDARRGARRGVYYARDMKRGHMLSIEDFKFLRPQYANIKPSMAYAAVGLKLGVDVKEGGAFAPADLKLDA